jgi:hypothetical protein
MDEISGQVKFRKLDGRNTGHGVFKYYARVFTNHDYRRFTPPHRISYEVAKTMNFLILRKWAWDTWGPSCEFREYMNLWRAKEQNWYNNTMTGKVDEKIKEFPINAHWCFENDPNKEPRIYLTGDEEKMWFEMRWL